MQQIVAHPSVESPFLNDVTLERAQVSFSYIHRRGVKRFNQVPRYFFRRSRRLCSEGVGLRTYSATFTIKKVHAIWDISTFK